MFFMQMKPTICMEENQVNYVLCFGAFMSCYQAPDGRLHQQLGADHFADVTVHQSAAVQFRQVAHVHHTDGYLK